MKRLRNLSIAILALGAAMASADRAVVVGINQYPGFDADEQLAGAVADSEAIEARLKALGFEVTRVNDQQATKSGIKSALDDAAKLSKPSERFVFYFAGHGWRNIAKLGHAAIVPSDASKSVNTVEILPEEIAGWVKAVPASARTIILDSCFSGAMVSRSFGLRERSLEYPATEGVRLPLRVLDSRDLRIAISKITDTGIVYFAASSPEQKAYERRIDGKFRGLFSSQLEKAMMGQPGKWQNVVQPVVSQVTYESTSLQKPELMPAKSQSSPFLGAKGTDPGKDDGPAIKTLWDQFTGSAVDPQVLSITPEMASGQPANIVDIGDQFSVKIAVNRAGYLMLLNKGTSGRYYLFYPPIVSGSPEAIADSAKYGPGLMTFPPDGSSFEPDASGTEEIRVVLVTDRQEFLKVAKTIAELRIEDSRSFDPNKARDLGVTDTRTDPGTTFFTSDLQISVRPDSSLLALLVRSQPRGYSMGLNPATDVQIKAADKLSLSGARGSVPSQLLLTRYLPPVKNQGQQGSCVAWAIGYYAYGYSLNEAMELDGESLGKPEFMVSPAYIYNQINFGRDTGSYIADAAKLIKERGAATMSEMSYSDNDFLTQPSEEAHRRADINKAIDVFLVGQDNRIIASEVKTYLAESKLPLVFGMPVYQSFMDMPSTSDLVYLGRGGAADPLLGHHAMCIVGYDDSKQAFRVVNSWGAGWGDKGFVWISYDFLAAQGFEDWGFMPGGIKARNASSLPSFKLVKGGVR